MSNTYRTAPEPITTMPPGIPYIVGNEAAERFSYYGMRAILVVFMTKYMVGSDGAPDICRRLKPRRRSTTSSSWSICSRCSER